MTDDKKQSAINEAARFVGVKAEAIHRFLGAMKACGYELAAPPEETPTHPTGITVEHWLSYQPFLAEDFGSFKVGSAKYYTADTVKAAWAAGAQCSVVSPQKGPTDA